jgi:hypothetical protein
VKARRAVRFRHKTRQARPTTSASITRHEDQSESEIIKDETDDVVGSEADPQPTTTPHTVSHSPRRYQTCRPCQAVRMREAFARQSTPAEDRSIPSFAATTPEAANSHSTWTGISRGSQSTMVDDQRSPQWRARSGPGTLTDARARGEDRQALGPEKGERSDGASEASDTTTTLAHLILRALLPDSGASASSHARPNLAPAHHMPQCSICRARARVPFGRCWFCDLAPSWHHGCCCPRCPPDGTWFEWAGHDRDT